MSSRDYESFHSTSLQMRMYRTAFCTLWLTWLAVSGAQEFKIVCYFASWADYRVGDGVFTISDIDPTLCTHVMYTFVGITEDGNVKILDPWNDLADDGGHDGFARFVALRELSPETKFMVSMGGWNEGSVKYSNVVANSTLRSNLVENVVNFTLFYGFDGFDIDWEYPNQRNGTAADVENFVLLLRELRAAFDEVGLILSAAVAAGKSSAALSYDIPGISESLHFINLMAYEYHASTGSTTGHDAPLYGSGRETIEEQQSLNVDASVTYWLDEGAPPEKLILGVEFQGKSFTLNNSAENEPGSPGAGPGEAGKYSQEKGTLFYYEICERLVNDSWTSVWDEEQRVPYAFKDRQWVSYDDVRSIKEKGNYIKERRLGGAMVWIIDEDDFRGNCGAPKPLLNTLNVVLCSDVTDHRLWN